MQRHFDDELAGLQQTLLAMGGLVEDQIGGRCAPSPSATDALAQDVIDRDRQSTPTTSRSTRRASSCSPSTSRRRGTPLITTIMKVVTDRDGSATRR